MTETRIREMDLSGAHDLVLLFYLPRPAADLPSFDNV